MTRAPTTALVIRAAGINCDQEMARGFALAGADVDVLHVRQVVRAVAASPAALDRYGLIGLPGGFSYGDDVASGRVLALLVREKLYPALRRAAERGVAMIGICNGFQVLTQAGLLPGPGPHERNRGNGQWAIGNGAEGTDLGWPDTPRAPEIALCDNELGRYADRWVRLSVNADSPCVWTRDLAHDPTGTLWGTGGACMLPVGHGEGRFVAPKATVDALLASGRAPLTYIDNFNGSAGAIAGVCDATGRIFGLMPHPDRFLDWTRHPHYTRLDRASIHRGGAGEPAPGLRMFMNAVEAAAVAV
jgi:phosphoribosylformylglycinamidine synthase